jgi:alpha-tubulin suppressor-like RCC1 family protein
MPRSVPTTVGNVPPLNLISPVQIGSTSWSKVSAGTSYSVGIRSDNTLYAWGINTVGQIGDGTTITKSSPVLLSATGISNFSAISAGLDHVAAITTDGRLYTWGNFAAVNTITVLQSWTQISHGGTHTLAVRNDGALFAWGNNAFGQLGDNTLVTKSSPVQIGTGNWSDVSAGVGHSIARTSTGTLFGWGLNNAGQLGLTNVNAAGDTINRSSPVQLGSGTWVDITASVSYTSAINSVGELFAWGLNNAGQLGNSSTINRSSPVQVTGAGISWSQVSAGGSFTLGVTSLGALYAWGLNSANQLGNSATINRSSPSQIGTSSWTTVSAGISHSLATTSDSRLWTWGQATAIGLAVQPQSWTSISSGQSHAIAVKSDGSLWAWGANASGQLGDNTAITRSSPVLLNATSTFTSVFTKVNTSYAIRSDGALFAWGLNTSFQIGNGDSVNRSSPVQIGTSSWTAITSGVSHALGITSTGALFGWGVNGQGQLGLNDATTRSVPTQIGSSLWSQVNANSSHSIAIRSDGNLFAWGLNAAYQIGDFTTINKSSPVQITSNINTSFTAISAGFDHNLAISTTNKLYGWGNSTGLNYINELYSWTSIASGTGHIAAIRSDGLLYVWGLNSVGQLGTNDIVNRSSPVLLGNPNQGTVLSNSWSMVHAGSSTTVALRTDGTLWSWGLGTAGELGTNTAINRSSPTQIGTDTNWTTNFSVGLSHTIAIKNNNTAYAWGLNTNGQLGINDGVSRSSPVQVTTALVTSWNQISAGTDHTLGVASTTNLIYGWGKNDLNQTGTHPAAWMQLITVDGEPFGQQNSSAGIKGDGSLWYWGSTFVNQSPHGNQIEYSSPVQVGTSSWIAVGMNGSGGVAVRADRTLWGWGAIGISGVGDGIPRSSPVQIGSDTDWSDRIFVGPASVHALKTDGKLYGWNTSASIYYLGDGITYARSTPTLIAGASWSQVTFTHGIKSDGTLWAWGSTNATTINGLADAVASRSSMVQVGTSSWLFVSAGNTQQIGQAGPTMYAIDINYRLFSWGINAAGQIGDNTAAGKNSPVLIGTSSWIMVGGQSSSARGIDILGRLYGWGISSQGNNGTNTTISRSTPTQIATGTSFAFVASRGQVGPGAITTLGDLNMWGSNIRGGLGFNNTVTRSAPALLGTAGPALATGVSAPTQISYFNLTKGTPSWIQVSAGQSTSLAITSTNQLFVWGLNNAGQLGFGASGTTLNRTIFSEQVFGSWVDVSSGISYTMAERSDGGLFAWGLGTSGQLGTNTAINRSSPTQIGTSSYTYVNAGGTTTAAIRLNQTIDVFGLGTSGQIGDNTAITKSSPVLVGSTGLKTLTFYPVKIESTENSWIAVSAGLSHSAAVRATGALFAWGLGTSGQVGDNTAITKSSPVQLGVISYTSVNAGSGFIFATRNDNILFTWGLGTSGQLGDNSAITKSSPVIFGGGQFINQAVTSPIQLGLGFSWTKVSAGNSTSMAVKSTGELFVWGLGTTGQLGQGNAISYSSPVQIGVDTTIIDNSTYGFTVSRFGSPIISYVSPFATGQYNTSIYGGAASFSGTSDYLSIPPNVALTFNVGDYTIEAWIYPTSLAAVSTITSRWTGGAAFWRVDLLTSGEINLVYNPGGFTTTGAGIATNVWYHIAVVRSASIVTIYVNGVSRLTPTVSTYNMEVTGVQDNTQAIYIGTNTDGASLFRGFISNVRLVKGLGVYTTNFTPSTQPLTATQSANVNGNPSLAITGAATGLLTLNTMGPVASWAQISTNLSTMAAIRSDGILHTWGDNANATLGNTAAINRSSPVLVQGIQTETKSFITQIPGSWSYVSAGQSHTAAVSSVNTLWAWGLNTSGQIGTNDVLLRSSPTQIGLSSWTSVFATGGQTTYGIKLDGNLFAWGLGTTGQTTGYLLPISRSSPTQIGNNFLSINQSSPAQIAAGSWSKIGAGQSFNVAIRNDGLLFTWAGQATSGQLGDGTTVAKSIPTQIGTSSWVEVSAGLDHVAAIRSDKILFTWGFNSSGALGTFDTLNRSSPTLLAGAFATTSWNKIAAASTYTLATDVNSLLYTWGSGSAGQLGLNNANSISSPTQVSATISFVSLTGGSTASGGITNNGIVYHWGNGVTGQLGELFQLPVRSSPTTLGGAYPLTNAPLPTPIGTDVWRLAAAGNSYSVAIRSDYKLFAWGLNTSGQLGLNDNITRSSPVQISTKDWITINAGLSHTTGITR